MIERYNWMENDICFEFSGDLNLSTVMQMQSIVFSSSKFDSMNYQILNFMKIDSAQFSKMDALIISALTKNAIRWNKNMKVAFVTQNAEIIKICKFIKRELKNTEWEFKIFRDMSIAQSWCLCNKSCVY
jgi:hypothetical protein